MLNRWWTYQKERFPIAANGLLIGVFSFSAVSYSALLRGGVPSWDSSTVAFAIAFLFFLQLRIADEFKDYEEDCRFRPYRPVPRGLVSLRELGILGALTALIQGFLALYLGGLTLGLFLIGVWLYLGLMSQEFFIRDWLKAHPIIYLISHMMIMPLIYGLATACDWQVTTGVMPSGLGWFLAVSFFNGVVIEIGRKIRSPKDEEAGVDTYSYLWGRKWAVFVWLVVCTMMAVLSAIAANLVGFGLPLAIATGLMLGISGTLAHRFLRSPLPNSGKRFEYLSAIWTLLIYLSLGIIPLLISP
ncbi:MAG: UbiA family prenyltransferase [Roseofilum sp. Belize BBD 4]|uniref:UbiA family prenyltransferase n=1 Tax=Roseofilum sp. Belize BBD 4 TaxID=2821500 RepID=UPI001B097576|nr:UbiA family prenyltransferase [Roseofilum sp. Belize BBD 4]MBP0034630.1 UbiA family prenyltransferase [Roseofilum sp. Belize BBD 4]